MVTALPLIVREGYSLPQRGAWISSPCLVALWSNPQDSAIQSPVYLLGSIDLLVNVDKSEI